MRLIDADKMADFVCSVCGGGCDVQHRSGCIERNFTEQCAKEMPTVDAVPVMRCKDCVHFWNGVCKAHIDVIDMDENDFCSLGERNDEID